MHISNVNDLLFKNIYTLFYYNHQEGKLHTNYLPKLKNVKMASN